MNANDISQLQGAPASAWWITPVCILLFCWSLILVYFITRLVANWNTRRGFRDESFRSGSTEDKDASLAEDVRRRGFYHGPDGSGS